MNIETQESYRIAEIAENTGIGKSTVYEYLNNFSEAFQPFQTQIGNAKCLTQEGFDLFKQILDWKRRENLTHEQITERLEKQGYIITQKVYGNPGIFQESYHTEFLILKQKLETVEQEAAYFKAKFEETLQELSESRKDVEQSRQRQDTIILQLTRQLEEQTKLLEYHRAPWWKRWYKKADSSSSPS